MRCNTPATDLTGSHQRQVKPHGYQRPEGPKLLSTRRNAALIHGVGDEIGHTRQVRNWVLVSAAAAPVALIGGWTLAQTRQSGGFDPVTDTISALAGQGAQDRWIMTVGLFVLGVCHVLTAAGLTEAAPAGRIVLALGGAATIVVAASPQPAAAHIPAAAVGFGALTLWPAFSALPDRRSGVLATAVMLVLLAWLGVELRAGNHVGLSERLLAGSQALWPLVAVLVIVASRRRVRSIRLRRDSPS